MYGRRYSKIFRSHEYAAFLRLPEVQFSSAPTEAFLKLLTMEKPGNMSMPEAWIGHLAESNGVLVAISMRRIIRSTDNGENWEFVISEGGVAFDVKQINGGFAAILPLQRIPGG